MISDKQVEAAWAVIRLCGTPVGAGDGNTYIPRPPTKDDIKRALEAAERAAWLPADTCPSDGRMVLVYRPLAHKSHDQPLDVKRAIGGNRHCWPSTVPDGKAPMNPTDGACHVSMWRDLPQPPKETT